MPSLNYSETIAERQAEPYHSGGLWIEQLELIQQTKEAGNDMETKRPRFMTIDDLIELARRLADGLMKLGAIKHPLGIRRGVSSMVERTNKGEMLKAVGKTYFFDIKETREGKPYLIITESRLKGEGEKPERSSILIFQDNIQEFANLVNQMATKISPGK